MFCIAINYVSASLFLSFCFANDKNNFSKLEISRASWSELVNNFTYCVQVPSNQIHVSIHALLL